MKKSNPKISNTGTTAASAAATAVTDTMNVTITLTSIDNNAAGEKNDSKKEKDNNKKSATKTISLTAATSATGVTATETDTVITTPSGAAVDNNPSGQKKNYSKTVKVNNKNTTTPKFANTGVSDNIGCWKYPSIFIPILLQSSKPSITYLSNTG